MTLPGPKLQEFHEALLDAFTRAQLERIILFTFNEDFDSVVRQGNDKKDAFFELIKWARGKGKLGELIKATYRDTQDNPKLSKFYAEWIQDNTPLPTDTEPTAEKIAAELAGANIPPIIDRLECIELFLSLLDPAHDHRFLRVVGKPKMGKSHLLTKVFPQIARYKSVKSIIVDLREQSSVEILQNICSLINPSGFSTFDATYKEWIERPISNTESLSEMLGQRDEKTKTFIAQFTRSFVSDLQSAVQGPILLLFDQLEGAPLDVQRWLCSQLLVQLQDLSSIHVVVGGRSLPPLPSSYERICYTYDLVEVEEEKAYLQYCRQIQADIADEFVPQLAKALFYSPGAFAESMTQFTVRRQIHG